MSSYFTRKHHRDHSFPLLAISWHTQLYLKSGSIHLCLHSMSSYWNSVSTESTSVSHHLPSFWHYLGHHGLGINGVANSNSERQTPLLTEAVGPMSRMEVFEVIVWKQVTYKLLLGTELYTHPPRNSYWSSNPDYLRIFGDRAFTGLIKVGPNVIRLLFI